MCYLKSDKTVMYKRPPSKNGFQYKEPKTKMRKLDVSLLGASNQAETTKASGTLQLSRPSTSKAVTNDKQNECSSSNNKPILAPQPQPSNAPPSNDENLWGDADDECILIASQMVDNMDMDAINQQIIVQSMNLSQNNAAKTKLNKAPDNFLKDLLQSTEEEDRIFSELNNFDNIGNINQHMNEYLNNHQNSPDSRKTNQISSQRQSSPSVFKIPAQIRPDKRTYPSVAIPSSSQNDPNISFRPENQPQSTQFSQRIPKPLKQTEAQTDGENLKVKFLTQKQCDLQKKIEHLESENQKLTDQCQMKDGEASLLRSEYERLKTQCDVLRKEKSDEIAKNKYEHGAKITELEKEILNLKSQLQFKEIPTKQFRKFNSTALSQSIDRVVPESSSKSWEKFILPNKSCIPIQGAKPVDPRIYISSNLCDSNWISIYDKKQWEYLNGLQVILADLMAIKDYSNNGLSKTLDEIFNLASLSVNEMYASSMSVQIDLKRNEFSYTHSEIGDLKEYSIVSENRLFHQEEAFLSRRILICLATICEQFTQFSSMLFIRNCRSDNETKSFMELLSLTLQNFCHYRHVTNIQGLVESSCLLLTTLAVNYDINVPKSITVTGNVLHNILLSRPGIGSLEKISKFLELMSYRCETSDFLDSLCLNKNTQDILESQRFIRYTKNTCTLQIYALLIRLYILPHKKWKFSAKQLTSITQSILLFMRNSFLKSPKWLSAEKRGNCLCRVRLFGATVTLLYVYLLHWIESPGDIDSQTLSIVSKFGVEFLYESLVKNFEPDLLNVGGTIIKNRIRLIVEWLNLYDFQFEAAHRHALQTVCLQRLGPMVEYLRYNKNITKKFSEEASELYNDVVNSFFNEFD